MALTAPAAHARAEATYRPQANKLGLWLFFLSETFLFSAMISARFVTSGTDTPEHLNQPLALAITVVLLLSSISAYLSENAIANDDRSGFMLYTRITILLGLLFTAGVVLEWREALADFPAATIYGSAFFALIGLHAFHVVTGIMALGVVLNLGGKGHFGSEDYWPVEGTVKYWHLVDLMWVVIYPSLYLF